MQQVLIVALHEEIDEEACSVFTADQSTEEKTDADAKFHKEIRKAFNGYNSFHGAGLPVNRSTHNLIAKSHGNLCHLSNDRLACMICTARFATDVVETAKTLVCQICDRVAAPGAASKVNEKRHTEFNVLLGSGNFVFYCCNDKCHWVCHFVDAFNTWQARDMVVERNGVTSEFAADTLAHFWMGVFGAPVEVMCDQGKEFLGG